MTGTQFFRGRRIPHAPCTEKYTFLVLAQQYLNFSDVHTFRMGKLWPAVPKSEFGSMRILFGISFEYDVIGVLFSQFVVHRSLVVYTQCRLSTSLMPHIAILPSCVISYEYVCMLSQCECEYECVCVNELENIK